MAARLPAGEPGPGRPGGQQPQPARGWQNAGSKYKGVSFRRNRGKWLAHICYLGQITLLGHFDSEVEAAKAYDRAARALHGELAFTNF